MADVSTITDGFFVNAQEGFVTSTSGSVSSGATTVGLNSVAGYTDGDWVTLAIDPTLPTKKQVFHGKVDASGSQITDVTWTEGNNQTHTAGATVVDYETATAWSLQKKGFEVSHNQDGTFKGEWQNWTPTYQAFTLGNGTLNYARYTKIGNTVHLRIMITRGSTSSFTGTDFAVSLPIIATDYQATNTVAIGQAILSDIGTQIWNGVVTFQSTHFFRPQFYTIIGSSVSRSYVTNTQPFTWVAGDLLLMTATYEAA